MAEETPAPLAEETRVYTTDGQYFSLPVDAYSAVRDAVSRGCDYEGLDRYGDDTFICAGFVIGIGRRTAAGNARREEQGR